MNLVFKICYLLSTVSLTRSHTHEEIAKCTLAGVHKSRQTIIESPNYPNNYTPDGCWDYVIRSPYKCPTTFHIQFLDFYLEFSKDCRNDYLAIGLDNVDDDMDILCGQVVGIKKYHTPDGVLRLRFFVDESAWTTGKGFKLLVTRLACEREELLRELKDDGLDYDSKDVAAPSRNLKPPDSELMQIFRNLTGQEQYQTVPVSSEFNINYPTQLPSPPLPATSTVHMPIIPFQGPSNNPPGNLEYPCTKDNEQGRQLARIPHYYDALKGNQLISYFKTLGGNAKDNYLGAYFGPININPVPFQPAFRQAFLNNPRDENVALWSTTPSSLRAYDNVDNSHEACCVSAFQQKHFYLSSPGFPGTIFNSILPNQQRRDCVFLLKKFSPNVCRLYLDFKFFDFGQAYHGTGSFMGNIGKPGIENTQDVCGEDYIEIDNQRFCGCRLGYKYSAYWSTSDYKHLRMRLGYSVVPSSGFLLEIVQEECCGNQFVPSTTERTVDAALNSQVNKASHAQQAALLEQYKNRVKTDSYVSNHPIQQLNYMGQTQQLLSPPPDFPSYLQYKFPPLLQPQQHLQTLQHNNLYPAQFVSSHLSYGYPQMVQQSGPAITPLGLQQIRYARSYRNQKPIAVVETNATRKEFYYTDNDSQIDNENLPHLARSGVTETLSQWDRKDENVEEKDKSSDAVDRERKKCTFDMSDILHLSVDILWITKPICYAPKRSAFTNWIL